MIERKEVYSQCAASALVQLDILDAPGEREMDLVSHPGTSNFQDEEGRRLRSTLVHESEVLKR